MTPPFRINLPTSFEINSAPLFMSEIVGNWFLSMMHWVYRALTKALSRGTFCTDRTLSAASVCSNVHPVNLGITVLKSGSKINLNTTNLFLVEVNSACKTLVCYDVQLIEVHTSVSHFNVSIDNTGKSESVRKLYGQKFELKL